MSPSLTCPGRESTGEIINNTVPLENSIPGNCCSALFKNLVRGLWGAVGGHPQARQVSSRGCGEPRRRSFCLHPPCPHPIPQLLKKIKRCERKGTESVTEEKCAVLQTFVSKVISLLFNMLGYSHHSFFCFFGFFFGFSLIEPLCLSPGGPPSFYCFCPCFT